MQMTLSDIREIFEQSAFFKHMGFEIVHFAEDKVLLKLAITAPLINVNGTLHGGVHAAMLDQICGMVIRATTKNRCATINLNLNYLAPSSEGDLFATAKIIQQGYRIAVVEGEIFEESGNLVAKGMGTFKLMRD